MKPIHYDAVISECALALQVRPRFVRALLRRARAFEGVRKYEMAMQDVQSMLIADPNHQDALEIARRLRMALGARQEAQLDLHSRATHHRQRLGHLQSVGRQLLALDRVCHLDQYPRSQYLQ